MTVLLVVATLLFFLGLDYVVRRVRARNASPAAVPATPITAPALPVRIPDGIFFAKTHTWINLFPSGKVRLGVDDFVTRLLASPKVQYLKKQGDHVQRGEPILRLQEGDRTLTVRAPLSGIVLSANQTLMEHPEKMKELLFSEGWAYTIQPDKTSQLRGLLLGEETHQWVRNEFARLRDLLAGVHGAQGLSPALLQDGGVPVAGLIDTAPAEVWKRFENEFLTEA
jgi:glycine cleavage system H protein